MLEKDEEDWIARHHRKLDEARRKNKIRRDDRSSMQAMLLIELRH